MRCLHTRLAIRLATSKPEMLYSFACRSKKMSLRFDFFLTLNQFLEATVTSRINFIETLSGREKRLLLKAILKNVVFALFLSIKKKLRGLYGHRRS